jgi:integrase/recombinase XerC
MTSKGLKCIFTFLARWAILAITAYLDASDGNIRAAQGLSRHANLNTLTRYDDNRHKYQAIATNTLADLV